MCFFLILLYCLYDSFCSGIISLATDCPGALVFNLALSYLLTPLLGQHMTQGQFFKRGLTGLNSEFSFSETTCLTKAEETSLSYYLPIARGRIIGSIPFPWVLVLCKTQPVSSRIWTRVSVSISCNDKNYTTGTSQF